MSHIRDEFAALLGGDQLDLGRGALVIARLGHPDLDPEPSLAALDALADAAATVSTGASPAEATTALATHLFGPGGFRGNTEDYYDPRNSFLNDVLARRTGIPITLAVVLMETARRLGLRLEGVGFPGHFLVRAPDPARPLLLDPFHGGRVLTDADLLARFRALGDPSAERVPPQALRTAATRDILARMLRNLERVYLEREEWASALDTVELLLVLDPDSPADVRLRGLLWERLECYGAAGEDLRRYLALAPDAPDAARIRTRLADLARRGPTLH
jgi:regulator of sirC expression with transglutaminase-like and TPR domain